MSTKSGIFNVHDIDAACLVVVAIVNMCDSVNMCDFVMLNKFEVNKMHKIWHKIHENVFYIYEPFFCYNKI